jgi:hypothetical protein
VPAGGIARRRRRFYWRVNPKCRKPTGLLGFLGYCHNILPVKMEVFLQARRDYFDRHLKRKIQITQLGRVVGSKFTLRNRSMAFLITMLSHSSEMLLHISSA